MTVLGEKIYLGRTPDGDRVYVDVEHVEKSGEAQTVHHETILGWSQLSIMGVVYTGRSGFSDSQCVSAGQCIGDAEAVLARGGAVARGAAAADVRLIVDAWKRWHLNDMRAGCAHVEPVGDDASSRQDQTPACPETGYRYGSAWLVEPLPYRLVADLADACARLGRA